MTEHPALAYLRAALDRAEETAREACPGPWEPEGDDPTDDEVYTAHDGEQGDLVGNPIAYVRSGFWGADSDRTLATLANMRHIAAFDPDAVLAMVAADRELIDACQAILAVDGWDYSDAPDLAQQVLLLRAKAWGWKDEPRD